MKEFEQSPHYIEVMQYAQEEAGRLGHTVVNEVHLFLGMIRSRSNSALQFLKEQGYDIKLIKSEVEKEVEKCSISDVVNSFTETSIAILNYSILESIALKDDVVGTRHLLLAFLHEKENKVKKILNQKGMEYEKIFDSFNRINQINMGPSFEEDEDEFEDVEPTASSSNNTKSTVQDSSSRHTDTPMIDKFGIDLTLAARENELDPMVGRDKEVERIVQILSRRRKNNPILIGDPGVGKTAIVEGLATRIIERKVSRTLINKRIISIDMGTVVAGTKFRGQFEERLKNIIKEFEDNHDLILYIDEIHTLVGSGATPGSLDGANIIKPALSRGKLQCIGSTTYKEYTSSIEKDGALERRFQKVVVEPTTKDDTLEILKNIKDRYESHHQVIYGSKAIEACVNLTDRYVRDRAFPDKAIDALDEAGARTHVSNLSVPNELIEIEKKIDQLEQEKRTAARDQNFELAAQYRDEIVQQNNALESVKTKWLSVEDKERVEVTEEAIAKIVSMMSNVPVEQLVESEGQRLLKMESEIKKQVIGQNDAVDKIVRAIQRNRVGLKDPNRPIGSFFFLGPTGVGKTLLVKKVAEYLFGSSDALIRVDMSEYMEKFNVSRLVGSAPGYVGYEEGGQLTEQVRRKPYSIVLFDEIEKAHEDVYNLLLQIIDEGFITDAQGRNVDFKNTIIVMTSNVGAREVKNAGRSIGYDQTESLHNDRIESIAMKALQKKFSPEFLNRLDEIINFHSLSDEDLLRIVDIELAYLNERISSKSYTIELTDKAKQFLVTKGSDKKYGARPLRRSIQKYIENLLTEKMLSGELVPQSIINIDMKDDDLVII